MSTCEPGRFCPDHSLDPGLLVLIAVTIVAFALAAVALAALVAVVATAAGFLRRRITLRKRPATEEHEGTPPHLDVMAAAVEDWWLTTDPAQDHDTGAAIAAHVEMYLLSSGYHITPNP